MFSEQQLLHSSKFLSFVLRHRPEAIGITLDSNGWVDVDTLLAAANQHNERLDRTLLEAVVAGNDKKRFTFSADGQRIRAAQGHSTKSISVTYAPVTPPAVLYHGTADRFLGSILSQGLRPGSRQYVHLSQDVAVARSVGARHGKPVILTVAAATMQTQGHEFYQAENGVWLTVAVPPEFLQELP